MSTANASPSTSPTTDLLAIPEVQQQVHRISVETYHRLGEQGMIDEKTELIRGVVVDKMSESPLHNWIVDVLAEWLRQHVGPQWKVREGHPVTLSDSEPEPDVCVVLRESISPVAHPQTAVLAIEVAISSERMDRQKASIYAEAQVDEYWIVYGKKRLVEVHLKPRDGQYTETKTLYPGDVLRPVGTPEMEIAIEDIFPPNAPAQ